MNSSEEKRRKHLKDSLESYRGRQALYREGKRFCRVRVDDFKYSGEGLSAQVTLIPTEGLDDQWSDSWQVFSRWEKLKDAEDFWVSPYIGLKWYFDSGLINAIVDWSESFPCEEYDNHRFDQIVLQIQKYRKARLARQLAGELKFFFNEKQVGRVSEHFLDGETDVHGHFALMELDENLKLALNVYRAWWENTWGKEHRDPAPNEKLGGDWWLETQSGQIFRCAIPIINFTQQTIILRRITEKQ